jgi:hypothetical protein
VEKRLTVQAFAPHLDSEFTVEAEGSTYALRLTEATPHGAAPAADGWQPFELLFEGPRDPLLPQSTYRLNHPDTGPLDIFLVPIGQDADCSRYQAVFG